MPQDQLRDYHNKGASIKAMLPAAQEEELFRACRVLFGDGLNLSREFLDYIQWSGVKSAYRRRVHEFHPDKSGGNSDDFIALQRAYEELGEFLAARKKGERAGKTSAAGKDNGNRRPGRRNGGGGRDNPRLPRRPLLLGHYLYYSGLIDWRTIVRALVWQRQNRPRLGEIAREAGMLSAEQVRTILSRRRTLEPFGAAAVKLGLLDRGQVDELLRRQRLMQRRFGEYFVEKGIFSREEMLRLVIGLERHNALARNGRSR